LTEQSGTNPSVDAPGCCAGEGSGQVVALSRMAPGQCGIIRRSTAEGADGAYLRALGLRVNQRIRLCRCSGPWIVEVGCQRGPATRIGLARDLAAMVEVEVALPASDAAARPA
jgi:hypothetical protein